jgi:hypothetical protein
MTGKTGATIVVVPGVCGFCVRGPTGAPGAAAARAFSEALVARYAFHAFARGALQESPLRHRGAAAELWTARLLAVAARGDVAEYKRLRLQCTPGAVAAAQDYDQR